MGTQERPVIRVEKGQADAEELAAVTVVLLACLAGRAAAVGRADDATNEPEQRPLGSCFRFPGPDSWQSRLPGRPTDAVGPAR